MNRTLTNLIYLSLTVAALNACPSNDSPKGQDNSPDANGLPGDDSAVQNLDDSSTGGDSNIGPKEHVIPPGSWKAVESKATGTLYGIWGNAPDSMWAVGYNGALVQWNGTNWSAIAAIGLSGTIRAVQGVDDKHVWIAGSGLSLWDGMSWAAQSTMGLDVTELRGIWTGSQTNSVFVGVNKTVTSTTAAIIEWEKTAGLSKAVDVSATGALNAIWGKDASELWAVGENGLIMRGTKTGTNRSWDKIADSKTNKNLFAVFGFAANDVWAVGDSGTIIRWNGTEFKVQPIPVAPTAALRAIWGSGPNDIWVSDIGAGFIHWDGTTWKVVPSGVDPKFYSLWGFGPSNVWAGSEDGTILHFTQ